MSLEKTMNMEAFFEFIGCTFSYVCICDFLCLILSCFQFFTKCLWSIAFVQYYDFTINQIIITKTNVAIFDSFESNFQAQYSGTSRLQLFTAIRRLTSVFFNLPFSNYDAHFCSFRHRRRRASRRPLSSCDGSETLIIWKIIDSIHWHHLILKRYLERFF